MNEGKHPSFIILSDFHIEKGYRSYISLDDSVVPSFPLTYFCQNCCTDCFAAFMSIPTSLSQLNKFIPSSLQE